VCKNAPLVHTIKVRDCSDKDSIITSSPKIYFSYYNNINGAIHNLHISQAAVFSRVNIFCGRRVAGDDEMMNDPMVSYNSYYYC
jgi:hypothetical protein